MKEIKQKPAGGKPKTADAARVPKAVVKAAWLQAREAARAGEKQVVGGKDGAYSGAADTGEKGADKLVSTGERVTELAYRGGRKLAERSAGQRRERAKAAQTGGEAAQRHGAGETIAHTSTIEASRPPQTREAGRVSDENRPAGARPQQRESRAVGRAKPIKPGREMKQGAPGPKTTEQAGKARQAVQAAARNGQAKARFTQRAQQTAKRAVDTTKRATDAARAGMRALVEALHSLLIALAAGGSVAVLIVVLICLIAFVAGSAYGIFFAAEAPGEDAFTVQQAVEQLGGEYRDYLQQIESTMPHDRQEIKANDDVYYIRWQDVLAVFSSYVSGAEDGAPVAYLDESRLQQLRQTMWDMNEVALSIVGRLENGLDTRIGASLYDDGIDLSGGETQKIVATRTLLDNADIWIFDEPVAAMDPSSEYSFFNTVLEEDDKSKTMIFVSHRLKIASKMNRIIYLENGKIVGIGTHQQLMTGCEKYRRYYVSWLLMEND